MKDSLLQPDGDGRVRCSAWLGGVVEVSVTSSGFAVSLRAIHSVLRPAESLSEREAALGAAQAALRQIRGQIRRASESQSKAGLVRQGGPQAMSESKPQTRQVTEGNHVAPAAPLRRRSKISILAYREGRTPPNDPSSATRPARASDCNREAMAGFAAAHG